MEHTLRCNALKCRRELTDKALVTTCSHIFCTECANRLGLTDSSARHSCPACNVPLTNPDDAVITNLKPTEDYKTSVLSGLSPNIIVECASRALNFWAYQTIQQIIYQEHVSKALADKYTTLTVDLDKVISEANAQITTLNNKVSRTQDMDLDQQALRRKNEELALALKEKNKKLMQTQELYDKLKRRAMMGQMQHAAEDAVDSNLPSLDARDGGGQGSTRGGDGTVLGLHEGGMGPIFPESRNVRIHNNTHDNMNHARSFNHRKTSLYPWGQVASGPGGKCHFLINSITCSY
ncbi:hypothetical protein PFICI_05695 [Pestalotiopsis fici W106-1]|uniref:RING-type domain-containing protein n=1 Tax=Pestalotiopsis fici (strain W106-1 / CGMCC3.15140) TaxID=1229662 RepID=W3XCT5_PESFW|nr:uncharacterized protein PFICI_05695 [Pestalotiopsis fici W106-1]ETS83819.1 hypothetical protein PFICI_05695 [Pestalotiopsis fici W106-1]